MSDVLKAVILGVVQGLTEFLPVSSTGHLVIAEKALGLSKNEFGLPFDAAIHLGTLSAVLVYFRVTILDIVTNWLASLKARRWDLTPTSRLAWLLVIGTIPGGLAGLALQNTVEDAFRSPALVAVMLIIFSLPLYLAERMGPRTKTVDDLRPPDALGLGVAQAIALIPGVSRSGITMTAGMFGGLRREQAATFAFLLSAPIVAAAGGKQLFDIARGHSATSSLDNAGAVYAAGLLTAALVGFATISVLMRYLRVNKLDVFVWYRVIAGMTVLALVGAGLL